MTELISTFATVLATAKKLHEVAKKVQDAEARSLIGDLTLQLAGLKMQLAEVQDENTRLRCQLSARSNTEALRSNLKLRGKVYYFQEAVQGRENGPYCPRCFDVDERLVLVTAFQGAFKRIGDYNCPQCKAAF
jgi:hypothetical protein